MTVAGARLLLPRLPALSLRPVLCSESTTKATRGRAVLTIFSMQGWGKLTAAIMNYGLVATLTVFGGPWSLDGTWRFALAFGCALNILTIYFRWWVTGVYPGGWQGCGVINFVCSCYPTQAPNRKQDLH